MTAIATIATRTIVTDRSIGLVKDVFAVREGEVKLEDPVDDWRVEVEPEEYD